MPSPESDLHALIGKVFRPDPYVFRQLQAGDRLDRPSGTTHALLEVDWSGDPVEVMGRASHPDRLTACGKRYGDLGEGFATRSRYLSQPDLDGYVAGGGVDCPECIEAMEVCGVC